MRAKAILTLIGGILIHLTLGTLYTSSNLTTYVLSYLHVVKGYKVSILLITDLSNRKLILLYLPGFLASSLLDK